MINSPRFAYKHIDWSLKNPIHDQNLSKSVPAPTHGETEKIQQK